MLNIGKLVKIWLFCEGSVVNEYIRSCNDTLFKTKIDEIDTPFKTKSSENHTLSGRTSLLRPYRGVPPPGSRTSSEDHWIFAVAQTPTAWPRRQTRTCHTDGGHCCLALARPYFTAHTKTGTKPPERPKPSIYHVSTCLISHVGRIPLY